MPYDNEYNRMVADDVMRLNQKYLEHDRKIGAGMSGGFLGSLAGMLLPTVISGVSSLFGNGMSGGEMDEIMPSADAVVASASKSSVGEGGAMPPMSGFAAGTFRDTGFDSVLGAEGKPKRKYNRRKKMVGGTELGTPPSDLVNNVGGSKRVPVANMMSSSMAGGAMGMGEVEMKKDEMRDMLRKIGKGRSGAGRSGAGRSGAGRSGAGRSGAGRSGAGRSGAGRSGAGRSGAGRSGAGRSGAGVSGGASGINLMGAITGPMNDMMMELAKKVVKSKKGKGRSGAGKPRPQPQPTPQPPIPKPQPQPRQRGMDGRKKRAEIVKKIMREKGLKMIEASKYVKENNLY